VRTVAAANAPVTLAPQGSSQQPADTQGSKVAHRLAP